MKYSVLSGDVEVGVRERTPELLNSLAASPETVGTAMQYFRDLLSEAHQSGNQFDIAFIAALDANFVGNMAAGELSLVTYSLELAAFNPTWLTAQAVSEGITQISVINGLQSDKFAAFMTAHVSHVSSTLWSTLNAQHAENLSYAMLNQMSPASFQALAAAHAQHFSETAWSGLNEDLAAHINEAELNVMSQDAFVAFMDAHFSTYGRIVLSSLDGTRLGYITTGHLNRMNLGLFDRAMTAIGSPGIDLLRGLDESHIESLMKRAGNQQVASMADLLAAVLRAAPDVAADYHSSVQARRLGAESVLAEVVFKLFANGVSNGSEAAAALARAGSFEKFRETGGDGSMPATLPSPAIRSGSRNATIGASVTGFTEPEMASKFVSRIEIDASSRFSTPDGVLQFSQVTAKHLDELRKKVEEAGGSLALDDHNVLLEVLTRGYQGRGPISAIDAVAIDEILLSSLNLEAYTQARNALVAKIDIRKYRDLMALAKNQARDFLKAVLDNQQSIVAGKNFRDLLTQVDAYRSLSQADRLTVVKRLGEVAAHTLGIDPAYRIDYALMFMDTKDGKASSYERSKFQGYNHVHLSSQLEDFYSVVDTLWHEGNHIYQNYVQSILEKTLAEKEIVTLGPEMEIALLCRLELQEMAYTQRPPEQFSHMSQEALRQSVILSPVFAAIPRNDQFNRKFGTASGGFRLFKSGYFDKDIFLRHSVPEILRAILKPDLGIRGRDLVAILEDNSHDIDTAKLTNFLDELRKTNAYGWRKAFNPNQIARAYRALNLTVPDEVDRAIAHHDNLLSRIPIGNGNALYLYGRDPSAATKLVIMLDGHAATGSTFDLDDSTANFGETGFYVRDGAMLATRDMADVLNDPSGYMTHRGINGASVVNDIWVAKAPVGLLPGQDVRESGMAEVVAALAKTNPDTLYVVMRQSAAPRQLSSILTDIGTAMAEGGMTNVANTFIAICRPSPNLDSSSAAPEPNESSSRFWDAELERINEVDRSNSQSAVEAAFIDVLAGTNAETESPLVVPAGGQSRPLIALGADRVRMVQLMRSLIEIGTNGLPFLATALQNLSGTAKTNWQELVRDMAQMKNLALTRNGDGSFTVQGERRMTGEAASIAIEQGSANHDLMSQLYDKLSPPQAAFEELENLKQWAKLNKLNRLSSNANGTFGALGLILGVHGMIDMLELPEDQKVALGAVFDARLGIGGAQLLIGGAEVSEWGYGLGKSSTGEALLENKWKWSAGTARGMGLGSVGLVLQAASLGLDVQALRDAQDELSRKLALANLVVNSFNLAVSAVALGTEIAAAVSGSLLAGQAALAFGFVGLGVAVVSIVVLEIVKKAYQDDYIEQVSAPIADLAKQYQNVPSVGTNGVLDLARDESIIAEDVDGTYSYVHYSPYHFGNLRRAAIDSVDLVHGTFRYATGATMTAPPIHRYFVQTLESTPVDLAAHFLGTALTKSFDKSQLAAVLLPIVPVMKHSLHDFIGDTILWDEEGEWNIDAYGSEIEYRLLKAINYGRGGDFATRMEIVPQATTINVIMDDKPVWLVTPGDMPEAWKSKITFKIAGAGAKYNRLSVSGDVSYLVRPAATATEIWMLSGSSGAPTAKVGAGGGLMVQIGSARLAFEAGTYLPTVYYTGLQIGSAATATVPAIPSVATIYKIGTGGVQSVSLNNPDISAWQSAANLLVVGEAFGLMVAFDASNGIVHEKAWNGGNGRAMSDVKMVEILSNGNVLLTTNAGAIWQQTGGQSFELLAVKELEGGSAPAYDITQAKIAALSNWGGGTFDKARVIQVFGDSGTKTGAPASVFYDSVHDTTFELSDLGSPDGAHAPDDWTNVGAIGDVKFLLDTSLHKLAAFQWNEVLGQWSSNGSFTDIQQASVVQEKGSNGAYLEVESTKGGTFVYCQLQGENTPSFHLISLDVDKLQASLPQTSALKSPPSSEASAAEWVRSFLSAGLVAPDLQIISQQSLINNMLWLSGSWVGSSGATFDALLDIFNNDLEYGLAPNGDVVLTGIRDTTLRTAVQGGMSLIDYVKNVIATYQTGDSFAPVIRLDATPNRSGYSVTGWYDTQNNIAVVPNMAVEPGALAYAGYDSLIDMAVLYTADMLYYVEPASGTLRHTASMPFAFKAATVIGGMIYVNTVEGLIYANSLNGAADHGSWTWVNVTEEWGSAFSDAAQLQAGLRTLLAGLPDSFVVPSAICMPGGAIFATQDQMLISPGAESMPEDAKFVGIQVAATSGHTIAYWFSASSGYLYSARQWDMERVDFVVTKGVDQFSNVQLVADVLVLKRMAGSTSGFGDLPPRIEGADALLLQDHEPSHPASFTLSESFMQVARRFYGVIEIQDPASISLGNVSGLQVRRHGDDIVLHDKARKYEIVLCNASSSSVTPMPNWKVSFSDRAWTIQYMRSIAVAVAAPGPIQILSSTLNDDAGHLLTRESTPMIQVALLGGTEGDVLNIYDEAEQMVGTARLTSADIAAATVVLQLGRSLSDGKHSLVAEVVNSQGSTSIAGPALSIRVETAGPATLVTIDSNGNALASDGSLMAIGSSNTVVGGSLSAPLGDGEYLQISFDAGANWLMSNALDSGVIVSSTKWTATDSAGHDASWSILARVVDALGNKGELATRAVIFSTSDMVSRLPVTASIDSVSGAAVASGESEERHFVAKLIAAAGGPVQRTMSGTLSRSLDEGEELQITVDGGSNWLIVGGLRNGITYRSSGATLNGISWTRIADIDQVSEIIIETKIVSLTGVLSPSVTRAALLIDAIAPTAFATILSMSNDTALSDWITADGSAGRTVAGLLSQPLDRDENNILEVSFNGGDTWLRSDLADNGVTVNGLHWSAVEPDAHMLQPTQTETSWTIITRVVDYAGNAGPLCSQVVTLTPNAPLAGVVPTILSFSLDTSNGQFVTSDGSAGGTVNGGLNAMLEATSVLQVSFDGGVTWLSSSNPDDQVRVVGLSWSAIDRNVHRSASWTVQARVVWNGVAGATVTQTVLLDWSAPNAKPSLISLYALSEETGNTGPVSLGPVTGSVQSCSLNGALSDYLASGETLQVSSNYGRTWATVPSTAISSNNTWSTSVTIDSSAIEQLILVRVTDSAENCNVTSWQQVHMPVVADRYNQGLVRFPSAIDPTAMQRLTATAELVIDGISKGSVAPVLSTVPISTSDNVVTWLYGVYDQGVTKVVRLRLSLTSVPGQVVYEVTAWSRAGDVTASLALQTMDEATWVARPYSTDGQSGYQLTNLIMTAGVAGAGNNTAPTTQQLSLMNLTSSGPMALQLPDPAIPVALTAIAPSAAVLEYRGDGPFQEVAVPVLSNNPYLSTNEVKTWLYGYYSEPDNQTFVARLRFSAGRQVAAVDYAVDAWLKDGNLMGSLAEEEVSGAGWTKLIYSNYADDHGLGLRNLTIAGSGGGGWVREGRFVAGPIGQTTSVNVTGGRNFIFGPGIGANVIYGGRPRADGKIDKVTFAAHIGADQIWFERENEDLIVRIIGSSDRLIVQDWFFGGSKRLRFQTNDGHILRPEHVAELVRAMAGHPVPNAGLTRLPQAYLTTLNCFLSVAWGDLYAPKAVPTMTTVALNEEGTWALSGTLSASLKDGERLEISTDGPVWSTLPLLESGALSWNHKVALAGSAATQQVRVRVSNAVGNCNMTSWQRLTLTTLPQLSDTVPTPLALPDAIGTVPRDGITPSSALLHGQSATAGLIVAPVLSNSVAVDSRTWLYGFYDSVKAATQVVRLRLSVGALRGKVVYYLVDAWTKAGNVLQALATEAVGIDSTWKKLAYANQANSLGLGLANIAISTKGCGGVLIQGRFIAGSMSTELGIAANSITFQLYQGAGMNVIREPQSGNMDQIAVLGGIDANQLWFQRNGNDLLIIRIGSRDRIVVEGWYTDVARQIQKIVTDDGRLLNSRGVELLVQAMAMLNPPPLGQFNLTGAQGAILNPVLGAAWQDVGARAAR